MAQTRPPQETNISPPSNADSIELPTLELLSNKLDLEDFLNEQLSNELNPIIRGIAPQSRNAITKMLDVPIRFGALNKADEDTLHFATAAASDGIAILTSELFALHDVEHNLQLGAPLAVLISRSLYNCFKLISYQKGKAASSMKLKHFCATLAFSTLLTVESAHNENGWWSIKQRDIIHRIAASWERSLPEFASIKNVSFAQRLENINRIRITLDESESKIAMLTSQLEDAQKKASVADRLKQENGKLKESLSKSEETLAAVTADNEHLRTEIKKRDDSTDDFLRDMERRESEIKNELESRRRDLDQRERSLAQARVIATHPDNNLAYQILTEMDLVKPASAESLIFLCNMLFDNELMFSNKAEDDLEEFTGNLDELWNAITALVNVYLPSCRSGQPIESRSFKTETGFELAANEAATVGGRDRLEQMRNATFDDRILSATLHLKNSAKNRQYMFRIYFTYDNETQKIAIVRAVTHLETIGTNR